MLLPEIDLMDRVSRPAIFRILEVLSHYTQWSRFLETAFTQIEQAHHFTLPNPEPQIARRKLARICRSPSQANSPSRPSRARLHRVSATARGREGCGEW